MSKVLFQDWAGKVTRPDSGHFILVAFVVFHDRCCIFHADADSCATILIALVLANDWSCTFATTNASPHILKALIVKDHRTCRTTSDSSSQVELAAIVLDDRNGTFGNSNSTTKVPVACVIGNQDWFSGGVAAEDSDSYITIVMHDAVCDGAADASDCNGWNGAFRLNGAFIITELLTL